MSSSQQLPAEPKIRAVLFDLGDTLIYLDVTVERLNDLRVGQPHSVLPATGVNTQFEEFQEMLSQPWEGVLRGPARIEGMPCHTCLRRPRNLGVAAEIFAPKSLG